MTETKYGSKKYYCCPMCWHELQSHIELEKNKDVMIRCMKCRFTLQIKDAIIFDSKAEYEKGLKLKQLEQAGHIQDLQHHEVFELLPKLYLTELFDDSNYLLNFGGKFFDIFDMRLDDFNMKAREIIEIPHQFKQYKSDFTYLKEGKKKVIEVKKLDKKEIAKTITDAKTGEKYKQKIKILWPKFIQPESNFRLKCQLMKLRWELDVEVWAENKLFRYNEKWKLEEVVR